MSKEHKTGVSVRSLAEPGRHRIGGFLLLLVLTVLAAGIIGAGHIYYRNLENVYGNEVARKLSAVAELKVAELVQWRKERLMDGAVFFKNPSFSALVRRFFENPVDEDAQHRLLVWLGKYPASGVYDQVRLLDTRGGSRLSVPGGLNPASSDTRRAASEALQSGQVGILDFYRHEHNQNIYLSVQIPILDETDANRPLGVLVLRIDPTTYLYPFIQHWPTPSPSAETLLFRRDGKDVLYLNDLRHRANTALTLRVPLEKTNILAIKAALGQTGIISGVDYRDVAVMGSGRTVPDSPWFLIAKMDTAEMREPLRKQFWQVIIFVGVMLFGAGTAAALLWKQQHVQLLNEKVAAVTAQAEMSRLMSEGQRIAHLGSFEYVVDTRTTAWSVEEFNIYGLNPAEPSPAYELMLAKCIHPDDVAVLREAFASAMHSGSVYELEHRIVRPDGSVRVVYDKAYPIFDSHGRLVKYIGATLDISERKHLENAIGVAMSDLERSNKELEQFAYVASHDLQEPLRMVASYTKLLAQKYKGQLDDKAQKYIAYAVDGAVRMQQLINDLLAYSRINTQGLASELTDSHAVLVKALRNLSVAISETGAMVDHDDLPMVRINASQLLQVFQNLISNAIKFRRTADRLHIHVSATDLGHEWRFSVKDNGIGIDMKYAEKIFVIFQRLHTTQEYPGTGIGLAMCKRIVERHGGRIGFESEIDKGTTFHFTLPK